MTDLQINELLRAVVEISVISALLTVIAFYVVRHVGRSLGRWLVYKVTQTASFKRLRSDRFAARFEARQARQAARIAKHQAGG